VRCFPFNTLNSGIICLAALSRQALTVTREGEIILVWSCGTRWVQGRGDVVAFFDLRLNNKSPITSYLTRFKDPNFVHLFDTIYQNTRKLSKTKMRGSGGIIESRL
jgi:hypothetical protein